MGGKSRTENVEQWGTPVDLYQSVIIIAVIPRAQIVIVTLVQNMRASQIAHQTQNVIVAETHDEKLKRFPKLT